MELVILSHILGDFYVQTKRMAEKKRKSIWYMLLHCFLYMLCMYMVFVILTKSYINGIVPVLIIGVSHLCVDYIKLKVVKRLQKYGYFIFLVDQVIHIAILIGIYFWFREKSMIIDVNLVKWFSRYSIREFVYILIAALVCWKPAALFISLVFKAIPKTVESPDDEVNMDDKVSSQAEIGKIGSWIGILEREIILLLGLLGQYGAIGFVLTAKSIARYKQLEKKAFAEKYLVGTLLSSLIALACVTICSQMM
ncbi:MAG TPA: DUF3307 domain-containing protein [Lachnospiraceae bacterium]|nr:DUF3307 domain-containing protein [Lachnospiraceae bacterium]